MTPTREEREVTRPGAIVRSRRRAPWTGVVLGPAGPPYGEALIIQVTHDRRGKPITHPNSRRRIARLHPSWLRLVRAAPVSSPHADRPDPLAPHQHSA